MGLSKVRISVKSNWRRNRNVSAYLPDIFQKVQHTDFEIGTDFLTNTGQVWRCTDVGSRTILAIEIHSPDQTDRDACWFVGPPYSVQEIVFDEDDIRGAYQSFDEHVLEALHEHGSGGHPGFPQEAISKMMKIRISADTHSYPNKPILRHDRIDHSGAVLHPFALRWKTADGRHVQTYDVYAQKFSAMPEVDFVRLLYAKPEDYKEK